MRKKSNLEARYFGFKMFRILCLIAFTTLPFLPGCTQTQQTGAGAGIGAALGGVAGYCIDGGAGGALLGAGLGGLAGGVAGHATHKGDKIEEKK